MIAICPDQNRLRQFSLGQLNEEQSDVLFTHVSDCQDCQQRLADGKEHEDTLTEQLRETAAESSRFSDEVECQAAMTKALAVLANAHSNDSDDRSDLDSEFPEQKLPEKIGDYEVVRMIGRGGMGNVYLARHAKLGREVALKVIAAHRAGDPMMHGRFESELRAVGKLDHPNVVRALDAREEDGVVVLVTEFIDGLDLGEVVRRVGPLNPADAAKIVSEVAQALVAIDEANMVHRDIKPSNIMISTEGQVKLLDLGLARLQGDGTNREFTMTGQAIGTVDYLAPEQINGKDSIDIRTDVYGLGCTLFKLLTGEVPFGEPDHSTSFAKMTAHVSAPRPTFDRADIPRNLASLTHLMMSVKPSDRPVNPAEVAKSIDGLAQQSDLSSLVRSALETHPVPRREKIENRNDGAESKLKPQPWWNRSVPVGVAIASGLFGLLLGWLLSVIITIKHPDGTVTKMEVPDGSHVTIDDQGNAQVDLSKNLGKNADDGDRQIGNTSNPSNEFAPLPDPTNPAESPGAEDPDADDLLGHLKGIWRLSLSGSQTNPSLGPNIMVFSGNSVAIYNDNRLMMEGTAQIQRLRTNNLLITPDNSMADTGKHQMWFSAPVEGKVVFIRNNDSVEIRNILSAGQPNQVSEFDTDDTAGKTFYLQRFDYGDDVAALPELIANDSTYQYSDLITAMQYLYESEFDAMELPYNIHKMVRRTQSKENLRYLILSLHLFHDTHGQLPASRNTIDRSSFYTVDANQMAIVQAIQKHAARLSGSIRSAEIAELQRYQQAPRVVPGIEDVTDDAAVVPPYSWRVAVLPFIGRQDLYDQYRFDEPWDSRHNALLQPQMPEVFRHPGDSKHSVGTRYLGMSGKHSAMGLERGITLQSISDGTSNSIILIESDESVPWTKPQDVNFAPEDPFQPTRKWFYDRVSNVAFADGSVQTINLSDDKDLTTLKSFLTIDDGEYVDKSTCPIFVPSSRK